MDIRKTTILVKGGGDLGSGVAWKLYRSGLKVAVVDLPSPMCIRREVSFSSALYQETISVDGVKGKRGRALPDFTEDFVPVFTTEDKKILSAFKPDVLVDATLKAIDNPTTSKNDAPLTIGLGPGFKAPENIDCIIETNRGHNLGRVIREGEAEPYVPVPGNIDGHTTDRILRAPAEGKFKPLKQIGDRVKKNELIGWVSRQEVRSGVSGIIRGLIMDGFHVKKELKIGDVDPRGKKEYASTVSDKARAIGGGVLEAVLHWALNENE